MKKRCLLSLILLTPYLQASQTSPKASDIALHDSSGSSTPDSQVESPRASASSTFAELRELRQAFVTMNGKLSAIEAQTQKHTAAIPRPETPTKDELKKQVAKLTEQAQAHEAKLADLAKQPSTSDFRQEMLLLAQHVAALHKKTATNPIDAVNAALEKHLKVSKKSGAASSGARAQSNKK